MSDDAKRHSNYRPGDDGNLTTGDFHKLVAEAFLSAMRPHYDMAAEEWKSEKSKYKEENKLSPYAAFRVDFLEPVEQVERARAEQSVRHILAMRAEPPTGKLVKTSSPTGDAVRNAPESGSPPVRS